MPLWFWCIRSIFNVHSYRALELSLAVILITNSFLFVDCYVFSLVSITAYFNHICFVISVNHYCCSHAYRFYMPIKPTEKAAVSQRNEMLLNIKLWILFFYDLISHFNVYCRVIVEKANESLNRYCITWHIVEIEFPQIKKD